MSATESVTDREKLSGLFRFAQGVLAARGHVLMRMRDTGLGCFLETDVRDLPGITLQPDEENWLVLQRLRETQPPALDPWLAEWVDGRFDDPAKAPQFKPVIVREAAIEEASDLCELGLLHMEDVHPLAGDVETEGRVKIGLRLEKLAELRAALDGWSAGPWEEWASGERPIRKSIKLYHSLFKLHNMMQAGSAGTPPELVWGIGIARWSHGQGPIDMPLIEQLVDLEVQPGGALAIKPREVRPSLSLKPFLEADVEGAAEAQRYLQERFASITDSADLEITPYDAVAWENLLDAAATRLSSRAKHVSLDDLRNGAEVRAPEEDLRIYSTWAIYGRPRSEDLREQDLERLRAKVEGAASDDALPDSIRGFVAPKPEEPHDDGDDWGLTRTALGGDTAGAPGSSSSRDASAREAGQVAGGNARTGSKVYFFPLAYNHEQAQIIDRLEAEDVVTVTGPPGTGKTHSIANIISHYMATGQRVLVTARTPEALAAVREKLPADLANLVIASVSSDREGVKQLEDAIQRLSDDVVTLDVRRTRDEITRLQSKVVQIDQALRDCDRKLSQIAALNLAPMIWDGAERTAMEMAEILAGIADRHAWMTDRPTKAPPATLDTTIEALSATLPRVAVDIVYLGTELPDPEELPTAADLLEAHRQEVAHRNRPREDLSDAPPMARDTADAEARAADVYRAVSAFGNALESAPEWARSAISAVIEARLNGAPEPGIHATVQAAARLLGDRDPGRIEYQGENIDRKPFIEAVERARGGQKTLSAFSAIFNRALADAVASIRLDGSEPGGPDDWQRIYDALEIENLRSDFDSRWAVHVTNGHLPALPDASADVMAVVWDAQRLLGNLNDATDQALPSAETLRSLFPYGLDVDRCLSMLDLGPILRALRANLKDDYQPPAALLRLEAVAARGTQPIYAQIGELWRAIGTDDVGEGNILAARNAITTEIRRLADQQDELAEIGRDLDALREAGAPKWAAACVAAPTEVERTLPADWRLSWHWALMKGRLDRITGLGNGDAVRGRKSELQQRREQVFERLIRERTLLGLKRRMTGPVQTALSTFTTAIRRLGKGTGKTAVRWRKAIRKAALEAAPAAPVWVMPEHKVAEQLPAEMADFDLVILDEASQSDITALSALARGKKHLIVGDEQQVSPSAVGIPQHKIDVLRAEHLAYLPNRDVIDENTSIFDIAMQIYPKTHLMLREHFRCVEPIIQFSTRFYNRRLIPIRVPKPSERFDPPLVDVFIKGGARRGKTNEAEACFIVDEIAAIARDPQHAHRDVAVISLIGGEQADLIERMLIEDPRVGTEVMEQLRIVCGDSRTMQGQERSIVFLSMVATPETARVQSSQAYAQRFNVALSRARDRLYLARSVSTHDLRPGDLKLAVLEHFAHPMPEGRALVGKGVLERCQSGFEREVCQRLLDANYRVRAQVKAGPFSIDLVVEGADDRRLAIELDGDAWHGPDKWHEDIARQTALERAGWTFWRVFGSQWIADKDHWWNNLVETMARMGIEPIGAEASEDDFTEFRIIDPASKGGVSWSEPRDSESAADDVIVPPTATDTGQGGKQTDKDEVAPATKHVEAGADVKSAPEVPHRHPLRVPTRRPTLAAVPVTVAERHAQGGDSSTEADTADTAWTDRIDSSRFYEDDYRETLRSIGCAIVDEAGPITFKHLCDRIARFHGFQRTGSEIKRTVSAAMHRARPRSHTRGDDEVFWPEDVSVADWVPFRGLEINDEERSWSEIPFPERLGLARDILARNHPEPDLAMARALGLSRLRAKTRSEINGLLAHARQTLRGDDESAKADSNVIELRRLMP